MGKHLAIFTVRHTFVHPLVARVARSNSYGVVLLESFELHFSCERNRSNRLYFAGIVQREQDRIIVKYFRAYVTVRQTSLAVQSSI